VSGLAEHYHKGGFSFGANATLRDGATGIFMSAVVIGAFSTALQSLDSEKEARRQKMDRIIGYLSKRKIPPYFQKVVLDFYAYM
jgi:hypothetical protein